MKSKCGQFCGYWYLFQKRSVNFFSSIDFIGRKPKLKLNQKTRNQTAIGGILCILLFAIFIPAALYFGQELVFRVLPQIIEASVPLDESDYIEISKNAFSFYVYLRNSKGDPYSIDGYLDISLEIINVTNKGTPYDVKYTSIPLEVIECNKNDIPQTTVPNYAIPENYLNQMKCIKNKPNTIIQGSNHHQTFTFLQLKLSKCEIKNICKDLNELRTSHLVFQYFDTEYNHRKFDDYSNLQIKEEVFSFIEQFDQEVIILLKKTEFLTDIGYMFEDFRLKQFHNIVSIKDKYFESARNNFLMNMIFVLDYSKSVNYRKYYKFQNWVAELGGIVKAISLIATIINYFNDKSTYYELMINKLFDVDDIIKYYQYFDINDNTTQKKKKRDSIVLLNAKKEKDYFEKEGLNRIGTDKQSFSNHFNIFKKLSNNKVTTSISKGDFELGNHIYTNPNNNNEQVGMLNNNNNISNSNININSNNHICHTIQMPRNLKNLPSNENTSEIDPHETYITNIKKNKSTKEHFEKIKKDRFSLNMFEQIVFCFCHKKDNPKYNALIGGKELLTERSDIIYILRKNLEFDRLKNLILKDNQMLLLNSLTKFMLDPERVNLIDFHNCNFYKFIDSYDDVISAPDMIDIKLSKWVETKFKLDHLSNTNFR